MKKQTSTAGCRLVQGPNGWILVNEYGDEIPYITRRKAREMGQYSRTSQWRMENDGRLPEPVEVCGRKGYWTRQYLKAIGLN